MGNVSSEELRQWEDNGLWGGVALLCGRASSLVVFDCDSLQLYEKLRSLAPQTWIVASGFGFHIYARLGEGLTARTRHVDTPWGH